MSKGRVSWKSFMKSETTSVSFLLCVLLVTVIVEGRIEIFSWPIKQVVRDCETDSDSKINLKNWKIEKVVSGKKKKQQFNKDKCKLPCRQKCFSKYRMGDNWVSQWSYDFLHPVQMQPFNDTEPMEKSHPQKWLFKQEALILVIMLLLDSKSVVSKPIRCWRFSWIADGPSFTTDTAIQQEMLKLLDWYR